MNTQRINPVSAKLKRGSEHYLNGKPVYIQLDRCDGTVCICNDKSLHPNFNFWDVLKSDLKTQPKYNTTLKVVKVKPATEKQKKDTGDLNSFFDSLADNVPFNCQNCRRPLYAFNKKAKRSTCCHIIPKKDGMFPELATDPDNIIFMGVDVFHASCDDHTKWDSSVEKRVKMPIYDMALKRYQEKLRHKLSPAKQQLADEYMGLIKKSQNLLKDIQEGKAS